MAARANSRGSRAAVTRRMIAASVHPMKIATRTAATDAASLAGMAILGAIRKPRAAAGTSVGTMTMIGPAIARVTTIDTAIMAAGPATRAAMPRRPGGAGNTAADEPRKMVCGPALGGRAVCFRGRAAGAGGHGSLGTKAGDSIIAYALTQ